MRQRCRSCGPVIFCRSRIFSSVRFLPFSSSNCASRKMIHVNVTRSPTDPWVAQQLREATSYGQTPTYLIRDNDRTFGQLFARVAATSDIKVLRTPYQMPRANAVCERFLGSVRRECLDHFLVLHEKQLHRLLKTYVMYYNQARPHQGIRQRIPDPPVLAAPPSNQPNQVVSIAVLGGLDHNYQRAASPQKAYFTPRTSEAYSAEQNGRVNVRGICISCPVFIHR